MDSTDGRTKPREAAWYEALSGQVDALRTLHRRLDPNIQDMELDSRDWLREETSERVDEVLGIAQRRLDGLIEELAAKESALQASAAREDVLQRRLAKAERLLAQTQVREERYRLALRDTADAKLAAESKLAACEHELAQLKVVHDELRKTHCPFRPPPDAAVPPALKALMDAFSTDEGKDELRQLFETLDKDGDGTVSGKEWGSAVKKNKAAMSKFFGGLTVKEIGQAFGKLDADGSGDLTWAEFEAGVEAFDTRARMAQALASIEGEEELKRLWDVIDADGNGVLTADEWAEGVKKEAETMRVYFGVKSATNKKAIKKAFKKLDTEGTGLTWEQFKAKSRVVVL